MNLCSASAAPIVVQSDDGKSWTFHRLDYRDLTALLVQWAADDRKELIAVLKEAGVDAKEIAQRVSEFNERARLYGYGVRCVFELPRAADTALASLRKSTPSATAADIAAIPMPMDSLVELAKRLWGYREDDGSRPPEDSRGTG